MRRFLLFVLTGTLPVIAAAHGVEYTMFDGGVGIQVTYNDNSPISYSTVKIYSPSDKETVFQQGMTDKNGRFVFAPDEPGEWKIEIDDGMGHGLIEEITVSEALDLASAIHHGMARWQEILVGVSILFGLTGIGFYIGTRRQLSANSTD